MSLQDILRPLTFQKPPQFNSSLKPHTSFKIGGNADCICFPSNTTELEHLIKSLRKNSERYMLLGKGSNTIFSDEGYRGCIIVPHGELKSLSRINTCEVRAGAGCMNAKLSDFSRKHGLGGAEFLSTIPGTVGGAVFMNAGAHGHELANILIKSECLTTAGEPVELSAREHAFKYRESVFHHTPLIILYAHLRLNPDSTDNIEAAENRMKKQRRDMQPINKHTWGSVFKNPPGDSAGRLIEQCGLKGKGFGAAVINVKHANFIENSDGKATFDDTIKTVRFIRETVQKQQGITLQPEVRIYDELGRLISV